MKEIIMLATVVAFLATPAAAQSVSWIKPNYGYCPPGSCNKMGGIAAKNVRKCSPANCVPLEARQSRSKK